VDVDRELTIDQAREIVRLRRRYPRAELRAHQKPWGVLVEVRQGDRTLTLERFDWDGAAVMDRPIPLAA
jgi:hypothetical protein